MLKNSSINIKNLNLKVNKVYYNSCGGKEIFIEIIDEIFDILIGFCRLRFPSKESDLYINKTALIRELHVYGFETNIGIYNDLNLQHRGYGYELLKNAEKIAIENNFEKISVISGIGAREYYKKYNYIYDGTYMTKILNN